MDTQQVQDILDFMEEEAPDIDVEEATNLARGFIEIKPYAESQIAAWRKATGKEDVTDHQEFVGFIGGDIGGANEKLYMYFYGFYQPWGEGAEVYEDTLPLRYLYDRAAFDNDLHAEVARLAEEVKARKEQWERDEYERVRQNYLRLKDKFEGGA
jgi:hypothetical protein